MREGAGDEGRGASRLSKRASRRTIAISSPDRQRRASGVVDRDKERRTSTEKEAANKRRNCAQRLVLNPAAPGTKAGLASRPLFCFPAAYPAHVGLNADPYRSKLIPGGGTAPLSAL